jgi:5-methylcytosine-specific restriction protein A
MSLRSTLEHILKEWVAARTEPFAQHPLAVYLRQDAALEVRTTLLDPTGLSIKGSAGAGQWAAVPWLAIFEDVVTDSATRGYYVVYLFHATKPLVHLSLNQGITGTRTEFKDATRGILSDRSQVMRRRLPDFVSRLPVTSIDLGSDAGLTWGLRRWPRNGPKLLPCRPSVRRRACC